MWWCVAVVVEHARVYQGDSRSLLLGDRNTDEQRAGQDLELAERNIRRLGEMSPRFSEIVGSLLMRFILVYDYGMGALELCELEGGEFSWRPGYRAPAG